MNCSLPGCSKRGISQEIYTCDITATNRCHHTHSIDNITHTLYDITLAICVASFALYKTSHPRFMTSRYHCYDITPTIFDIVSTVLEWVAFSCSRGSSRPRDQSHTFCICRWILDCSATRETYNCRRAELFSNTATCFLFFLGIRWGWRWIKSLNVLFHSFFCFLHSNFSFTLLHLNFH